MAANRKTKKKNVRLKKTAAKNGGPVKKTVRKKPAKKKAPPKRELAKKKPVLRKKAAKTKALGRKATSAKATGASKERPGESQNFDTGAFEVQGLRSRSAGQSGDLQGLSNVERADSESVDELIQEGNTFEADVVAGVESAGDVDEKEVRTHEVPEDDVPGEYLDKE